MASKRLKKSLTAQQSIRGAERRRRARLSLRSLDSAIERTERRLLARCLRKGLSIGATARRLAITANRVRRLARKHRIIWPTSYVPSNVVAGTSGFVRTRPLSPKEEAEARMWDELAAKAAFAESRPPSAGREPAAPAPVPVPAEVKPSFDARINVSGLIMAGIHYECGHRISMDNLHWITADSHVCRTCCLAGQGEKSGQDKAETPEPAADR